MKKLIFILSIYIISAFNIKAAEETKKLWLGVYDTHTYLKKPIDFIPGVSTVESLKDELHKEFGYQRDKIHILYTEQFTNPKKGPKEPKTIDRSVEIVDSDKLGSLGGKKLGVTREWLSTINLIPWDKHLQELTPFKSEPNREPTYNGLDVDIRK